MEQIMAENAVQELPTNLKIFTDQRRCGSYFVQGHAGSGQIIFVGFVRLRIPPPGEGLVTQTATKDQFVVYLDETKLKPTAQIVPPAKGSVLPPILIKISKKDYGAAQECLPMRIMPLFIEKEKSK